MIVRIMGEGQYELSKPELDALNSLDDTLSKAIDDDDDAAFRAALTALLDKVRSSGRRLPDDALEPSDFVLPGPDAHVDDVREMLTDEGLVPG